MKKPKLNARTQKKRPRSVQGANNDAQERKNAPKSRPRGFPAATSMGSANPSGPNPFKHGSPWKCKTRPEERIFNHAWGGPRVLSRQRRLHRRAPFYWAPMWEACLGRRLDFIAPADVLRGFLHMAIFQQNISHNIFNEKNSQITSKLLSLVGSGDTLGGSWEVLGRLGERFGRPKRILDASWVHLEGVRWRFGSIFGRLGGILPPS